VMTPESRWGAAAAAGSTAGARLVWLPRLGLAFFAAVLRDDAGRGVAVAVAPPGSAASATGSVPASLALRMEPSRRALVRVLSGIGEDLRDQFVDLGSGIRAALAGLEDAAPFQGAVAMDGSAADAGAGHR